MRWVAGRVGLLALAGMGRKHVECPTASVQGNRLFPLITFTLDTLVEILVYNLCLFRNSYNSYRDDSQCSVVRKKLSDKLGYKLRPFHERM